MALQRDRSDDTVCGLPPLGKTEGSQEVVVTPAQRTGAASGVVAETDGAERTWASWKLSGSGAEEEGGGKDDPEAGEADGSFSSGRGQQHRPNGVLSAGTMVGTVGYIQCPPTPTIRTTLAPAGRRLDGGVY